MRLRLLLAWVICLVLGVGSGAANACPSSVTFNDDAAAVACVDRPHVPGAEPGIAALDGDRDESVVTTALGAAPFMYDASTNSRDDDAAIGAADTASVLASGVLPELASPPAETRGTSTTLSHSFVATNTARPGVAIEPMWAQAPNRGFLGGWSNSETLSPGTVIDRYGGDTGRFFSPAGTPFEARALPAGSGPLNSFEVLKPFDVQGGIVAPAFGQPGLGVQYASSQTVADLIEAGIIKPVTP